MADSYQSGQTRQGDHEYGTIKVARVVPNSEIPDSDGNEFKGNEDHLLGGRLAVVCTDINQNKPFGVVTQLLLEAQVTASSQFPDLVQMY